MHRHFKAKVVDNNFAAEAFKLITLSPVSEALVPLPGQFYMLESGRSTDPLLKRPFSVFRFNEGSLQFLYRIRGRGTTSIAGFNKGDLINVVGPLGKAYPEPDGRFMAVTGGVGIASLYSLLERNRGNSVLFYGARNAAELLYREEAEKLSAKAFFTTDDGSAGEQGLVTDKLSEFIKNEGKSMPVYACGPHPMLRKVAAIAKQNNLKCYVSLEEHMACGIGACLGCVVKAKSSVGDYGYKRVCKEGPVFDADEVLW
ncbi:MAG: dihydroorotate dehydrogenase electron transfer subunit [Nitrospirae bacterium]|nr:MAG: dihydroorotate dehydrogenase electron transfer subunit [Nitrospirota bacterium]